MSAVVMVAAGICLKQVYGYVNGWEVPGKIVAKKTGGKPKGKTPRKKD
jgi:hypothetical protein